MKTGSRREWLLEHAPTDGVFAEAMKTMPSLLGLRGHIGHPVIFPLKSCAPLGGAYDVRIAESGLQLESDERVCDRMMMLARRQPGRIGGTEYRYVRFSQREEGRLLWLEPALETFHRMGFRADCALHFPQLKGVVIGIDKLAPQTGAVSMLRMFPTGGFEPVVAYEDHPLTDFVQAFLGQLPGSRNYDPKDIVVAFPVKGHARHVEEIHRVGEEGYTLLSDGGSVLTVSASTFDVVCAKLGLAIGVEVLRGNLILYDLPPYAEYLIKEVVIGPRRARMRFGGVCVRCKTVDVDPAMGEHTNGMLAWLRDNHPPRPEDGKRATCGFNTIFPATEQGKILRFGEPFTITEVWD